MDSFGVPTAPALDNFANQLIEEKGFPDLTPEVKEEIKRDILRRLDDFLAGRIIAALSDEDVAVFEEMLKQGKTQQEVQQFTTSKIPDFANFLTNTLMEFRGVYLGIIDVPANPQAVVPPPVVDKTE